MIGNQSASGPICGQGIRTGTGVIMLTNEYFPAQNKAISMALGATIYKVDLHVADTDRHYYDSHSLTIARHPSETAERMVVRLLAFARHAQQDLSFTKGLSETDEPDLWLKDLTGEIKLWIEVGQPTDTRILRACGKADQVIIYCYNGHASKLWWDGVSKKVTRARNLRVICLPLEPIRTLARNVERNMDLHVNIQEGELFVPTGNEQISLMPSLWHDSASH